ncbi:MAG: polysaccharide biosynthesis protein [Saprospiraceae bacterium]
MTELTRDLRSQSGLQLPLDYKTYPMNFGDPVFAKLFRAEGPWDIVANFAAHKHVRSEKDRYSIEAMLDNNVFKARQLLELLATAPPSHFFCVSTDKAANPVNVMGASKKLMEQIILSYKDRFPVTTARFANVAFSNGSLLAGYLDRLMKRQPISCPADVRRYFVSPEESGQICMLACILGESGDIFFPKLSEDKMLTFKEITLDFFNYLVIPIQLCSSEEEAKNHALTRQDNDPYPVFFFQTDTSGEKAYEEFYTINDQLELSQFHSLGVIKNAPVPSSQEIDTTILQLKQEIDSGHYDKASIIHVMQQFLPDFHHIETGKSLDEKM